VASAPGAAPAAAARGSRLPKGLRAFTHHNFRLFWTGQLVSLTGTWMQQVAQAWLVLELTNDPLALGIVAAAQFAPVLIFGLFAGLLADALSKRAALLWTQLGSLVLALVLGLLVTTGEVQVWHVYLLALGLGVVNAFDMPVRQSFVVEMVGREDVANAVALNSAVFNGTRIIGPAIAGVFIATIGLAPLFFFNAASYLAVVIGLLLMRPAELVRPTERAEVERNWRSVVDRLTEGLSYVRHSRQIFVAILLLGVVSTFALNFQVLVPVLARDVLGGQADVFGFLMASSGVGSLVSSLSIAFGQRPSMRLLVTGAGAVGVAMIGLGMSRVLPISMLLMFFAGWGVIAMAATTNTIIQLNVPDILRGRVMSVYTTVFAGSVPLGGLFAGSVAAAAGVPAALALGGLIALLAAFYVAWVLSGGEGLRRPASALRRRVPQR
jgi:predicted MFS family arabinose efflux permease